ncbi:MAG: site-specific DNA-methyltransferase [Bacteroidales bacterium]|nr:site-specific DNA-methyltransferase [Bacteroidales bacterium]
MNKLYFGDNLDILKSLHKEYPKGLIDLIYIDPPFNSKRNYNILFEDIELVGVKAQKQAFADTWSNVSYIDTLNEIADLNQNLYQFIKTLDNISTSKSSISYLTTMAIRIWYMHKLLKNTGSFYLHCDPTMSHYLKMVCDLIFGEKNFVNEIIWHYRRWTGNAKAFMKMHDIIFFYTKQHNKAIFNVQYTDYTNESLKRKQHYHTRIKAGDVYETSIDEKGVKENDVWQIPYLNSQAKERQGYPTQKPEALLEKIILASSNKGDLVADFFCGCGTSIAVAERLNRKWTGADISHIAVKLIAKRLTDKYGKEFKKKFEIFGFPKDIMSAKMLAEETKGGRLKFEAWIVEVMLHGFLNESKTQMGYDGHFSFDFNKEKQIGLIEVKSGKATPTMLNHFIKTLETKNGVIGIFVCFAEQVTKNMRLIEKQQGYYKEEYFKNRYPKVQIITVEDLMDDKHIEMPTSTKTDFKTAQTDDKSKQSKLNIKD